MNTYTNNLKKNEPASNEMEILSEYERKNIHPEYFPLSKLSYDYFITIKESTNNRFFCGTGRSSESFRKMTSSLFIDFFRRNLKLRAKELMWVACEEYGTSECAHVHILVKILKKKPRGFVLNRNCSEFKLPADRSLQFDVDVRRAGESISEREKVVSYFCKKEYGYIEKMFLWSCKFMTIFERLTVLPEFNDKYSDDRIYAVQGQGTESLISSPDNTVPHEYVGAAGRAEIMLTA